MNGHYRMAELKELRELALPVAKYLFEKWDPHCTIIITDSRVSLVRDEMFVPLIKWEELKDSPDETFQELTEKTQAMEHA